jgi:uncharacterized protein (TIGR02118 family)
MTVKLVVLYTPPDDAEAFEEHYLGVHGPLVEKIPGLLRFEGARVTGAADRGELGIHRVAELYFEDADSLQEALGSEEGRATGEDFQQIAPPGSRMYVATVD